MKNVNLLTSCLFCLIVLLIPVQLYAVNFANTLINDFGVDISFVETADIDDDGDLDIFALSIYTGQIFWLTNDGNQNFTIQNITTNASQPGYIKCLDMNNDGYKDLFCICHPSNYVFWLENDGNQVFTEHVISNSFVQPDWANCADLDNDNDIDVLVSSHEPSSRRFSILVNDGSMNFSEQLITNSTWIYTINVADVNDDGLIDIVPGSNNGAGNFWYENNGNLSFTQSLLPVGTHNCYEMVPADFDGDNDIDILACQHDNDTFGWHEQLAGGTFAYHEFDNAAANTTFSKVVDFDLDGDMDVISKPYNPWTGINLYENDGSMGFSKSTIFSGNTPESWSSLEVVDLDQDGDFDFLWASPSPELRWGQNDLDPYIPLEITGSVQGTAITSAGLFIDFDEAATDGYDAGLDIPLPASPASSYLKPYFYHPDWAGGLFGHCWKADIRDSDDDMLTTLHRYDLYIETDQTGLTVELSFAIPSSWGNNYSITLYDPATATYQDIRSDNTFDFVASAVTKELVLLIGDGNPPQISINSPLTDDLLFSNTPDNDISWNVNDISRITSTTIEYSIDGGTTWTQIANWPETWPGNHSLPWYAPNIYSIDARVRITCEDAAGYSSTEESGVFQIAPGYLDNNFATGWHMMAIPLIPADNGNDVVLEDDILGPYFLYAFDASSGSYISPDTTSQGVGYWLAITQPATIDVSGTPELDSVVIDLEQGWNIVGSGFPLTVARDEIFFSDGVNWYNFNDAVSIGFISSAFYGYDNSTTSYTSPTELDEWGGYWLMALQASISMIVYPPAPGTYYQLDEFDPDEGWTVPITLTQGTTTNSLSYFGTHVDASDGFDNRYDTPSPPNSPSSDFLSTTFIHPEWNSPVGNRFISNIQGEILEGETKTWNCTLESSASGPINLQFETEFIPDDVNIEVIIEGTVYNINSDPTIILNYSNPVELEIVANFQMDIDNSRNPNKPEDYSIASISPNPFNPITEIEISLPQASSLQVLVYNLLGQKIATIADGDFAPGYRKFTFDASLLSSGIYLVQAYVPGEMNEFEKITLIK